MKNSKLSCTISVQSNYNKIMFNWFSKKKFKKTKEINIFVCKHCKLSCRDCESTYCFSCFVNPKNPCPRCGKTNESFEQEKDT